MHLDEELKARLACPKCHGPLVVSDDPDGFACEKCSLFFAVQDGVPNFLLDDAKPWTGAGATAAKNAPGTRP